jgi:ATP-dependent helicase YprA (DUF1998 family)
VIIRFANVTRLDASGLHCRYDDGSTLHVSQQELAALVSPALLSPGMRLRVCLQDGRVRSLVVLDTGLSRPAAEAGPRVPQGAADHAREQPGTDILRLASTVQGCGVIAQVGAYHGNVTGDDGDFYAFLRARFVGTYFGTGDRVTFRADGDTHEIIEMSVLARNTEGIGGHNPCRSLVSEMEVQAGRRAMVELVRRFCDDGRLEWYWITPGKPAKMAMPAEPLSAPVWQAIRQAEPEFKSFFAHQARALDALRAHRHVLVLTPTASGKTYCYNPAVFQRLTEDPSACAMYVFPLNALLMDQLNKLEHMVQAMAGQGIDVTLSRLMGGMRREDRDSIDRNPPRIIATNPEMLCWILNRNSFAGWPDYLRRLRYVVLDEVHSYRSLLGLHMAGLMRRLLIACRRHGNPGPQFVLSSATVGAPGELATRLTSLPLHDFEVIGEHEDGSEQQRRHWMVLKPTADLGNNLHDMHLVQAAQALVDALTAPQEELNAILFAKSIRDVRFIQRHVKQLLNERGRPDLAQRVAAYASALLEDVRQRQAIYRGLRDGSLRAVISTNALEAGIDIGSLDVCIIAGFPYSVMSLRQMAGRAGRRREGAVVFVPHPNHTVDQFYAEDPLRLLALPAETFVIDHENPYIARRHVVACAASMAGGVTMSELKPFGRHLERIVNEARAHGILESGGPGIYTAPRRPYRTDAWAVGNLRSNEQTPYAICRADRDQWVTCCTQGCREMHTQTDGARERCPHLVQLLDRQYVYREAHPGAVFEDLERDLYRIVDLDDAARLVRAEPLGRDAHQRTFVNEDVRVTIRGERGRRSLAGGATIAWGDVRVTRQYSGYYEYEVVPRRRCRACRQSYDIEERICPVCNQKTRPYLETTRPRYQDFPGAYREMVYSLEISTISAWLILPAALESALETVSPCHIPGPKNRVTQFLKTRPAFRDAADLARVVGLSPEAAQIVLEYFRVGQRVWAKTGRQSPDDIAVYPAFYGQCLLRHLRQRMLPPQETALSVFAQVTGYPVLKDERHVCRNCVASLLVSAAHTVEHLVALRYPTVALGDSQDLGFTTSILHPQTQAVTIFWYDNYDGGIGAAEKVFDQIDTLLHRALDSLDCDCRRDAGCPRCTQTLQCDRRNEALSKRAARALLHQLLGMPAYVPDEPDYWSHEERAEREQAHDRNQRAQSPVRPPTEQPVEVGDPFLLLRVQPHVHSAVLEKAVEVRGEEIGTETPPISIRELQQAFQRVLDTPRPTEWQFPKDWTPYQVLHVRPEASKRLVHAAFKTIVRCVHPDVNPAPWATEMTQRVNAAWESIRDEWD